MSNSQSFSSASLEQEEEHFNAPSSYGLLQPFLKWAGGKRQLLPEIRKYLPSDYAKYYEPFLGAGAVLFDLQPPRAVINDANSELINCYQVIKSQPEELVELAGSYPHSKDYYYQLRAQDRSSDFNRLSPLQRAARIIYLNKTCFNGLFRVNSRGEFNVPFGSYKDPRIIEPGVINSISAYLNKADVEIHCRDFAQAVESADDRDFVYFDPPYDPLSDSSSVTGYQRGGFGKSEQQRLKRFADELSDRGCRVLLSNSATPFIYALYSDSRYEIVEVQAARSINSVGSSRDKISELLIFNKYKT